MLQAICLFLVVVLGQRSGAWFALDARARLLHVGADLFAVPGDRPATISAPGMPRRTTRVLYTAKGVAAIIGGWFAALLYERSGSWAMGFYGSAVMALVARGWPSGCGRRPRPVAAAVGVPAVAK